MSVARIIIYVLCLLFILGCQDAMESGQTRPADSWAVEGQGLDRDFILAIDVARSVDEAPGQVYTLRWADEDALHGPIVSEELQGRMRLLRVFDTLEEARAFRGEFVIEVDGEEVARDEVSTASCDFLDDIDAKFGNTRTVFVNRRLGYSTSQESYSLHRRYPFLHCANGLDYVWYRPGRQELEINVLVPETPTRIAVYAADYRIEEVRQASEADWDYPYFNYRIIIRFAPEADIEVARAALRVDVESFDTRVLEVGFEFCDLVYEGPDGTEGTLVREVRSLRLTENWWSDDGISDLEPTEGAGVDCYYNNGSSYGMSR